MRPNTIGAPPEVVTNQSVEESRELVLLIISKDVRFPGTREIDSLKRETVFQQLSRTF